VQNNILKHILPAQSPISHHGTTVAKEKIGGDGGDPSTTYTNRQSFEEEAEDYANSEASSHRQLAIRKYVHTSLSRIDILTLSSY
jgi:hypothetical protein